MYLDCDINICFRIIFQDEENGNEQHYCKVSIKTLTKYNNLSILNNFLCSNINKLR